MSKRLLSSFLRRLPVALLLLLGLVTLNFFLIQLAPGDAVTVFAPDDLDPAALESLREAYGLDESALVRYRKYISQILFHGNFGYSLTRHEPVADIIASTLPNTIVLMAAGLSIQYVLGLATGFLAAFAPFAFGRRAGSWVDSALRVGTLLLYSTPTFYLGLLLLVLLAGGVFDVLPPDGLHRIVGYDELDFGERLLDRLRHLILPSLTLGLGSAAYYSRYVRAQLLDVLREDWVRTARASGIARRRIAVRWVFRAALNPLITLFGLHLPALLGGSVVVENIFSWPGMGFYGVRAAAERDYPLFLAVNLVYAIAVLLGSFVADALYVAMDPRIGARQR